jgi:Type VI secretion system/phage-baseplate injector OB domain
MKTVSNKKFLYGPYRGIVEYNKDPLRIGRCKVRIPTLHGTMKPELLDILPWSRPKFPTPSGEDSGTFIVPEVGMTVWVQFEGGDRQYPIYEGGYHGSKDGISEVPSESLEGMTEDLSPRGTKVYRPSAWTLFKSTKGVSIGGQEETGRESFWIIDRVGQIFKSITPTFTRSPRGNKNMLSEEKYSYEDTSGRILTIFKSFGGGFIKFLSEKFKERVDLVSSDRDQRRVSGVGLSSEVGKVSNLILAEDKDKNTVVYINANASDAQIDIVVKKDGIELSRVSLGNGVYISDTVSNLPGMDLVTQLDMSEE